VTALWFVRQVHSTRVKAKGTAMFKKAYPGSNTILIFYLLFLIAACKQTSGNSITQAFSETKITESNFVQHAPQNRGANRVTFNLVPAVGVHSIYAVKYTGIIEIKFSASPEEKSIAHVRKESMDLKAKLETKVLSSKADGTWTLWFALTTLTGEINGERVEEFKDSDYYEPFPIMMDNKGRLLNKPENLKAGESYGFLWIYRNAMLTLPVILLPGNPIRVGESWQFNISNTLPTDQGPNRILRLKGTGILRSVEKNRAYLDLDFTAEFEIASAPDKWIAKATASVIYDLDKAQFLMNKISVTKKIVGFAESETEREKTLTETLEFELVR
jgi:hypothetical protein